MDRRKSTINARLRIIRTLRRLVAAGRASEGAVVLEQVQLGLFPAECETLSSAEDFWSRRLKAVA